MVVYKQSPAYEITYGLVGAEMCIRDGVNPLDPGRAGDAVDEQVGRGADQGADPAQDRRVGKRDEQLGRGRAQGPGDADRDGAQNPGDRRVVDLSLRHI